MSNDNIKQFTRPADRYELMLKSEGQFDDDLNEAIKKAILAGLPQSMLVGVMYSKLNDVESGIAVIVDGDEPA